MAWLAKLLSELPQFWKIPEMERVTRVTGKRDLEQPSGRAASAPRPALSGLQVKTDAFAVDQNRSRIDQLLTGTVVTLVAAKRGEGEKEFHGLGARSRARLGTEMKRAAESQTVKLRIVLEVAENGTDQMRDVVVESQGRKAVAGNCRRLSESGIHRQLEVYAVAERNEVGRCVGNEVDLGIEFLHHAVENRLDRRLHRREGLRRSITGRLGRLDGFHRLQSGKVHRAGQFVDLLLAVMDHFDSRSICTLRWKDRQEEFAARVAGLRRSARWWLAWHSRRLRLA